MEPPVLTDAEAETSMDLDESLANLNIGRKSMTRSVFNITLEDSLDEHESVDLKSYEEQLLQEIKDWGSLWRDHKIQRKQHKITPHPIIDSSYLSAEKRAYLEKAPDLQKFIRDSIEFRQAAHVFLEMDCAQMIEMKENLIEDFDHRLTVAKENAIAANLANQSH